MKTFLKFEFTPTQWATLRKLIEQTTLTPTGEEITSWVDCAVVELGNIVITPAVIEDMEVKTPAVLSDKWAVDILFYSEVPKEFAKYAVWPESGVHTFQGCESMYMENFYNKFPDKKPNDPAN
jgi:hypothetical protein